jgi:anti-sigma-K factor RskA
MTRSDRRNAAELLLAERAVRALTPEEQQQLEALLEAFPDLADEFDRAAAAIALAHVQEESLPEVLRARLLAQSKAQSRAGADDPTMPATAPVPASRPSWTGRVGWYVAAAAMVLAVVGWWPALQPTSVPGPVQQVQQADDRVRLAWQATDDPAASGARGEIVWSTEQQAGFMRFLGLAPNDPGQAQYQLWIFDASREPYPVDGGVFNIPPTEPGEAVVVPIRAKLPVRRPTMFAVTVEPPGGVVVSDQDRIVAVAKP